MKPHELAVRLMATAFAIAPAIAQEAYRINPTDSSILGLPVAKLDRQWEAASLVTEDNLPADVKADLARGTERSFKFSLEGDFNKDGRPDRAVVGVYRARGGEAGRFLLIVTEAAAGKWSVSFVTKHPGDPGPSLLYQAPDAIGWSPCVACDVFAGITWKRGRYRIEWEETDY